MIEYPVSGDREDGAWVDPGNIATFARVAEESGADGTRCDRSKEASSDSTGDVNSGSQ
jgi:hypothetical protein